MGSTDSSSPRAPRAVISLIAVVAFFLGCAREEPTHELGAPGLDFRPVNFHDIDGWPGEGLVPALSAFEKSCAANAARTQTSAANSLENLGADALFQTASGTIADWSAVCEAALAVKSDAPSPARVQSFFEYHFRPVQVIERRLPINGAGDAVFSERGKFTGYFEPQYNASRERSEAFTAPVYSRPRDLIEVDLGRFKSDLKGSRIAGRIDGNRLVPYADHAQINTGALRENAQTLAWMDPNDLLFLQIQGSGKLVLDDGNIVRVGYAGQNGHAYTAVGRVLVERNIMPVEAVTMQSIREWLDTASADDARSLREANRSYVFFRTLDELDPTDGPLGAQGVALTPGTSLAVDRRFHAMGAPVFVDIEPIAGTTTAIRKLMIAQDTGGAIRGPIRGDFFWGSGPQASENAGVMNAEGQMYVFFPKSLADRILFQRATSKAQ